MSKIGNTLIIGALLLGSATASAADPTLKVYDADVTVNEQNRTLDVMLELNMKDFKIGRDGEAIFTPVILSENGRDSLELAPFTVCGRNRYYYYMREGVLDSGLASIYRSGSKEMVKINESVPLEPWMTANGTVEVRQQAATCCSAPKTIPGGSANGNVLVARLSSPAPLQFQYIFAPPVEDKPVEKAVEGKAFVTFVVNKTDLNPTYMDNPVEIRKILNSIDAVKADPDAIITEVHIRGYASPEGSYANNERLAKGRTETLAKYVEGLYKFAPGTMTTSYDPEDWAGLRAYVKDSMNYNLTDRAGLLAIIDGPLDYDAKDAALKSRYPADYKVILSQIYPWLRHSDYAVRYNIKVYTDMENLLRLYNSDPSKLRAVDFYRIAQQYPAGSRDYLDVMKKAVEYYPDEPMINLNLANLYLMNGDLEAAQSSLLKAGRTPQADYARGVTAAMSNDLTEARKWFMLARDGGIAEAADALRDIEESQKARPVDIIIPTVRNNNLNQQ